MSILTGDCPVQTSVASGGKGKDNKVS